MVINGLRGLGKTVLLDALKARALSNGWFWAGTDLTESASLSEKHFATRLLADLAVVTSSYAVAGAQPVITTGFSAAEAERPKLDFRALSDTYDQTPGLTVDRLKAVLKLAYETLRASGHDGRLIFAYDEAQNLRDNANRSNEYPLSALLDTFQALQREGIPFMLVLVGLPNLTSKLVEARAYAERMFRIITLDRLTEDECREAITRPLEQTALRMSEASVDVLVETSAGYPYFVQFMCREAFDVFIQKVRDNENPAVPIDAIQLKLDADFFAGKWGSLTDRQRDLLYVTATLNSAEFSLQEVSTASEQLAVKKFSSSHVNQMYSTLIDQGLIYSHRYGKYSFALPLYDKFIMRQYRADGP